MAMVSTSRRKCSWLWKLFLLVLACRLLFRDGNCWVGTRSGAVRGVRASRPNRLQCRSWNMGPLGPVESAEAFRIYYLPFVEPIDIDGSILDQLFGGWFGPLAPLIVGALVFWINGQISAVRREQEGRVLGSAAKAVGDAAAQTASGAAQSLTEKLQRVPSEQWLKLFLCDATFLLPGLGELGDVAFAPLEALALRTLFGGTVISVLGFAEEALPFTDALPTATTGWVLQTLFSQRTMWTLALLVCVNLPLARAELEALHQDCADEGLHFVQSIREKRHPIRQVSADDVPFASLVESSDSSPEGFPQLKQVMALAQTRVQTKVGEAPYFIIAVAVGGFAISLLSICVSLVFVKGFPQDANRDGIPSASALLAHRLRAMGIGQPKSPWHRTYQSYQPYNDRPASWHFGESRDSPDRVQIVVPTPLEGGRVGLNLSEDDLVVNNFGDPQAHEFGFQIGDRITQVNGIPVFQESDFRFVMKDALQRHETTGEPLIFEVIRPLQKPVAMPPGGYHAMNGGPFPATSPAVMKTMLPQEDLEDITGEWSYGKAGDADQFTYLVRKAGDALSFEQTLPNGQKVTGKLTPEDPQSPWLRSELVTSPAPGAKSAAPGRLFGELRIHFDPTEKVLVSQVRPAGISKWGDERVAKRVDG